ncbi:MAG TPA: 2'-5' RNA ligase family protein [Gaiellaceae bacterium]
MADALRSAVIVAVPEAADAVNRWRERTGSDKPSTGVPPHVTLVFPFAPAGQIDGKLIAALREVVARVDAFELEFRETARWPELVYLPPEPAAPFRQLTEAIAARFPEYPPYEGAIPLDGLIPHLTVASAAASLFDEVEADVRPHLPIKARVQEAVLLEEVEPDWERWQIRARLSLRS